MSFPVICHKCNHTEEIVNLATLIACTACGSDDLDLHDGQDNTIEVEAEARQMGDFEKFPESDALKKKLDDEDAKDEADNKAWDDNSSIFADWAKSTMEEKAKTSAIVEAKLKEIAAGIVATNPSMTLEAALDVAQKTIARYPRVAGLQVQAADRIIKTIVGNDGNEKGSGTHTFMRAGDVYEQEDEHWGYLTYADGRKELVPHGEVVRGKVTP